MSRKAEFSLLRALLPRNKNQGEREPLSDRDPPPPCARSAPRHPPFPGGARRCGLGSQRRRVLRGPGAGSAGRRRVGPRSRDPGQLLAGGGGPKRRESGKGKNPAAASVCAAAVPDVAAVIRPWQHPHCWRPQHQHLRADPQVSRGGPRPRAQGD